MSVWKKLKNKKGSKRDKSSGRSFSFGRSVKDLVSGDFLSKGLVERNIPFLGFLTVLMLVYIGYQYYVDNNIRNQAALDKEHAELYSKLQSLTEEFNSYSLQTTVAEGTVEIGMFESVDPPTAIPYQKGQITN